MINNYNLHLSSCKRLVERVFTLYSNVADSSDIFYSILCQVDHVGVTNTGNLTYKVQCRNYFNFNITRVFAERKMSGSYPYGDRSPGKSVVATCRMDSCLLDPQQELLVAYREDNIR